MIFWIIFLACTVSLCAVAIGIIVAVLFTMQHDIALIFRYLMKHSRWSDKEIAALWQASKDHAMAVINLLQYNDNQEDKQP